MENSLQSPPIPRPPQAAEGSASPSPLKLSLSFKNGEIKTLERFFTARTRFETPEAERAELFKVFQRFDKDGDGKLSIEEIRSSLEKLGVFISAADLTSFVCAEPDGDVCKGNGYVEDANGRVEDVCENIRSVEDAREHIGSVEDESEHRWYVDFTDFCYLYRSLCQEESEEGVTCTPNGKLLDSELKSAFDLFDTNHDNYISVTELQSVLTRLGFKEANNLDECKSMIASVDSDGDGMVNFDEFKAMMRNIKEDP